MAADSLAVCTSSTNNETFGCMKNTCTHTKYIYKVVYKVKIKIRVVPVNIHTGQVPVEVVEVILPGPIHTK